MCNNLFSVWFFVCTVFAVGYFYFTAKCFKFFKTCAEFVLVEFICYTGADVCIITETTSDMLGLPL